MNTTLREETRLRFFTSLQGKLILLLLTVSIIPLITLGWMSYDRAKSALMYEAANKMIAVRDIKARQITGYFQERMDDLKIFSNNPSIMGATHAFHEAIENHKKTLGISEEEAAKQYRSLYLGKANLRNAGDGSAYSAAHAHYHQMFKEYMETYGYYDILMVEPHDGYIIYSVMKEADFATSLNHGPYATSNIAKAFQKALAAKDRDATFLEDFAYYEPSQEAASFVASSIFHRDEKEMNPHDDHDENEKDLHEGVEAVLIFQLSTNQIDSIMQERTGLGETGETILVSSEDFLLRSNSPLFKEKTLFKQKVDTEATRASAAGKTGVTEIIDYRGKLSLIAHMPLKISGVHWSLNAKIDKDEALATANKMLNWMIFIIGIGIVIIVAIAIFFSNTIATPIRTMTHIARQLADGHTKLIVDIKRKDEIGLMSNAFRQMIANLRLVIEDIVQVSQGLAAGNLYVTPQSEYRGDFIKIKEALEMALSNQSRVIDDIVLISQGLAEGKSVKAQAEYLGNFMLIKESLETASIKLSEATKQNAIQTWQKTGQGQLNELMSGEQEMRKLAKNIISFLTTYLEGEVGLFYLLKQDEQKPYLERIAAYAYTENENIPNKFQLGEGLVGEVALEKKMFSRIHTPEEYTHITQSGLSIAVPHQVVIIPFFYEDELKGVIEIGTSNTLTSIQEEFLQQLMPNIGIAVKTGESRSRMEILLEKSHQQAEVLQQQKSELQQKQENLLHSNEELQAQSEELQSQSEELQSQQEKLRQINEELEERTNELERQQKEVAHKNEALQESQIEMEKAKAAIELKAHELELASQYKSEFLAKMSHELRTPLNSVLILAQLLAKNKAGNLTDKQVEYAKTMHNAGSDLLKLINEILDLSKVEAGKIQIELTDVELTALRNTLDQKFRHVAENKGLTFQITLADNLPTILQTDKQRINQIVNNLLSNAFKFTREGGIKMTIGRPDNNDNLSITGLDVSKTIAISVTDSGIGIPKKKQQLIFEAFQQADDDTSKHYGGTGLGLSISRQLSRLLGGDLFLRSDEGKGSTFTLYLPEKFEKRSAQEAEQMPKQPSAETHSAQEKSTEQTPKQPSPPLEAIEDDRANLKTTDRSLLIIEDDRVFSKVVMDLAKQTHFKCLIAEDGKEGLEFVEKYKPNAIILDVGLPQLDGWSVMERLKDNPKTRHIPVHFMSGYDQSMDAKRMGAIGYLHKPINMEQLGKAFKDIEQFIDQSVKNLLVVVDNDSHQQKIVDLTGSGDVKMTVVATKAAALEQLKNTSFECMIIDVDVEQASGIQLLEQLSKEDNQSQIPVILHAERDLSESEQALLQQIAQNLTVKTVKSPERLLDEATLFLHQVASKLPEEQQQMLRLVHDKEAILKDKKVMIVDDDVRNSFSLMTVLEDKDMEVVVASNGKEALSLLEEHADISLILMDIMMPEMDGYETMHQIRKKPQYHQLPILAITAKAMKDDRNKCIEAGANDYLPKPVDNDKLLSMMRVWLYQ